MLSKDEQIANLERQVRDLDKRYTEALTEVARLKSRIITYEQLLEGADAIERSIRQRNAAQAETIERYREEVAELSRGYRS